MLGAEYKDEMTSLQKGKSYTRVRINNTIHIIRVF